MLDPKIRRARLISSVAATAIALACGTNYVYSAWAPQFADKLHYTTTQTNLIGVAGNLGMYTMGVPIGMGIDHRGPRPAVILGSLLLGAGYFGLKAAYDTGSGLIPLLCVFSYLTGLGGCMAFAASVKTSALNWPHHRGTATAFPLAAFGLSAFFFSMFGETFFPGDTGAFLMTLAVGTFSLPFVSFFFLRVLPHSHSLEHGHSHQRSHLPYQTVPSGSGVLTDSQELRRTPPEEGKFAAMHRQSEDSVEPGASSDGDSAAARSDEVGLSGEQEMDVEARSSSQLRDDPDEANERSSLMSTASTSSSLPGEVLVQASVDMDRSHRVDIRGWDLLRNADFWQLFAIMGILAGIGLMTINNIGHDANALWRRYDGNVTEEFLISRQQMHVSILSVGSFAGRLSSGVGSDFLVKVLHASRVWCLVLASLIFCLAQVCALTIWNPHLLGLVSGLSGLGYGFLFGVFPSIVAETFGIHGLSQNWGFMTLSPVISGYIFNLFYGHSFDAHSIVGPDGERSCPEGLECYRSAYYVTLGACGLGLIVTLTMIRHQRMRMLQEARGFGA